MKKAILATLLLIITSCQDNKNQFSANKSNDTIVSYETKSLCDNKVFSFEKLDWSSFNSHIDMIAATQIPKEIIHSLSSEELADHCINHPLIIEAYMYDDFQFGLLKVMESFNGYQEIIKRENCYSIFLNKLEANLPDNHHNSVRSKDGLVKYSISVFLIGLMLGLKDIYHTATATDLQKTIDVSSQLKTQLDSIPESKGMIISYLPDYLISISL